MTNVPGLPPMDDPDIVRVILERVAILVPEGDRAKLDDLELQVRVEYGGLRVRIPKRKKHMSPEVREQLFKDAMTSATDVELSEKYGIHKATLYRQVKRGVLARGK